MSIGTQINIEAFIIDFVLCEFTSQIGFLRSRAVWVYSRFSNLPLKSHEFKALGLEAVCKLLLDQELLVRHEASLALIHTPQMGNIKKAPFPRNQKSLGDLPQTFE